MEGFLVDAENIHRSYIVVGGVDDAAVGGVEYNWSAFWWCCNMDRPCAAPLDASQGPPKAKVPKLVRQNAMVSPVRPDPECFAIVAEGMARLLKHPSYLVHRQSVFDDVVKECPSLGACMQHIQICLTALRALITLSVRNRTKVILRAEYVDCATGYTCAFEIKLVAPLKTAHAQYRIVLRPGNYNPSQAERMSHDSHACPLYKRAQQMFTTGHSLLDQPCTDPTVLDPNWCMRCTQYALKHTLAKSYGSMKLFNTTDPQRLHMAVTEILAYFCKGYSNSASKVGCCVAGATMTTTLDPLMNVMERFPGTKLAMRAALALALIGVSANQYSQLSKDCMNLLLGALLQSFQACQSTTIEQLGTVHALCAVVEFTLLLPSIHTVWGSTFHELGSSIRTSHPVAFHPYADFLCLALEDRSVHV